MDQVSLKHLQHRADFCRQTARDEIMPSPAWFTEAAADLDAALIEVRQLREEARKACGCAEPDPIMQSDGRFYCHQCSFQTGARPRNLEPEDAWRAKQQVEAALLTAQQELIGLRADQQMNREILTQFELERDRYENRIYGAELSKAAAHGQLTQLRDDLESALANLALKREDLLAAEGRLAQLREEREDVTRVLNENGVPTADGMGTFTLSGRVQAYINNTAEQPEAADGRLAQLRAYVQHKHGCRSLLCDHCGAPESAHSDGVCDPFDADPGCTCGLAVLLADAQEPKT